MRIRGVISRNRLERARARAAVFRPRRSRAVSRAVTCASWRTDARSTDVALDFAARAGTRKLALPRAHARSRAGSDDLTFPHLDNIRDVIQVLKHLRDRARQRAHQPLPLCMRVLTTAARARRHRRREQLGMAPRRHATAAPRPHLPCPRPHSEDVTTLGNRLKDADRLRIPEESPARRAARRAARARAHEGDDQQCRPYPIDQWRLTKPLHVSLTHERAAAARARGAATAQPPQRVANLRLDSRASPDPRACAHDRPAY